MTRGALTTFSIANDVAKYFAIIPAAFAATYPSLAVLNVMHLATPSERNHERGHFQRSHHRRPDSTRAARASSIARHRRSGFFVTICSSTGSAVSLVPFVGIKAVDLLLVLLHLA